MSDDGILLEVLVACYGNESFRNLMADGHLEPAPHVRYLVSVQGDINDDPTEVTTERDDVVVSFIPGKGLSRNRNTLLAASGAPYLLLADDDIVYTAENLRKIIEVFQSNPNVDIAAFKVPTAEGRNYPEVETDLVYGPFHRTHYPCSVEIAIRRQSLQNADLKFDERFGIGSGIFEAGEEDVFLNDAFRKGLKLRFFPIEIGRHEAASTVAKNDHPVLEARGAVLKRLYGPYAWLRQIKLALSLPGPFTRNWRCLRKGAKVYRKMV